MLIDSHAHLNFEEFSNRWQQVAADCLDRNIWVINVGSQLITSKQAVVVAENFSQGIYAAVGLHPLHVWGSNFHPEEFFISEYQEIINKTKKIVAIGETGIDFYHASNNFASQQRVFTQQINLAKENNLALIIHSRNSQDGQRNAYQEILKILKQEKYTRGVIHCFGGTAQEAVAFLDLGFYLGFTGIITFKNAKLLQQIVRITPLEKLLIETDSPYLAPEPHRGETNQPQYVELVAAKVAELQGLTLAQIADQTSANAIKLFNLKT